ncbi:MAG: hypothetical protein HUU47_01890 [Bacteroidetes bacterium]|nr:hypothetical protein [Bacteroidota bacterium]
MKKIIQTLLLLVSGYLTQAKPVTVTINYPGLYIRTERWTDPSTCTTFDKIVCDPTQVGTCYSITYTYDDGTLINGNNGLEEGDQIPPVHVVLYNADGSIIEQGFVSFYQNYTIFDPPSIYSVFDYRFNQCNN